MGVDFQVIDRAPLGPREDVPLPTAPPYTVYVGNLPFDLNEDDLGGLFAPEAVSFISEHPRATLILSPNS
jgi:hypothetical protein